MSGIKKTFFIVLVFILILFLQFNFDSASSQTKQSVDSGKKAKTAVKLIKKKDVQYTNAIVMDVLKEYIGTEAKFGTKAIGLGSWIRGGNYRDPRFTPVGKVPSDHDIRIIVPKGSSDQAAFEEWVKAQRWIKQRIQQKFKLSPKEAQKVLASVNVYPPDQLIENVTDFADAKKRFEELLKSNPNLAGEELEGLFGKYNKAWRDKYELKKGVLIEQDPTSLKVKTSSVGGQIVEEGLGDETIENVSRGAKDWLIHLDDAIKKQDPEYIVKYLERLDEQLAQAKGMAQVKHSNYIQDLMEKMKGMKTAEDLTPEIMEELNKVVSKAKMEQKVLELIPHHMSDKRNIEMIRAILEEKPYKWKKLKDAINQIDDIVTVERVLTGVFSAFDGYMAHEAYKSGDSEGALRQTLASIISNLGLSQAIMVNLTNVIIEEAKENGYILAASYQDCDGLLAGNCSMLGRGQVLDSKDKIFETTFEQIIAKNQPKNEAEFDKAIGYIIQTNARTCADRGFGPENWKTDSLVGDATYEKCLKYFRKKWDQKRFGNMQGIKEMSQMLIQLLQSGALELETSPDPAVLEDGKTTIAVTITPHYTGDEEYIGQLVYKMNQQVEKMTPGWHFQLTRICKWFVDGKAIAIEEPFGLYRGVDENLFDPYKAIKEVTLAGEGPHTVSLNFTTKLEFVSSGLGSDPDDPVYKNKDLFYINKIITKNVSKNIEVKSKPKDKDESKDNENEQNKDKTTDIDTIDNKGRDPKTPTEITDKNGYPETPTDEKGPSDIEFPEKPVPPLNKTAGPTSQSPEDAGSSSTKLDPKKLPVTPPVIPPTIPPIPPDDTTQNPPDDISQTPPDDKTPDSTEQPIDKNAIPDTTKTSTPDDKEEDKNKTDKQTTNQDIKSDSLRDEIEAAYKAKDWEKLYKLEEKASILKEKISAASFSEAKQLTKEYLNKLAAEFAQEHTKILNTLNDLKARLTSEYNANNEKTEAEIKKLGDILEKLRQESSNFRIKRDYDSSDKADAKYKEVIAVWNNLQICKRDMDELFQKTVTNDISNYIGSKEELLNKKLNDYDINGVIRRFFYWDHKSQSEYINDEAINKLAATKFDCKCGLPEDKKEPEKEIKTTVSLKADKTIVKAGEISNITAKINSEGGSFSCKEDLSYDWSGQNIGSGGSMNKQSSVSFVSSKSGPSTIGVTIKCGNKVLGSDSVTINVQNSQISGKITGLPGQVYYGSSHSISVTVEDAGGEANSGSAKQEDVSDACKQQRAEMAAQTRAYEDCLKTTPEEDKIACMYMMPGPPPEDFCGPYMNDSSPSPIAADLKITWNSSPNLEFNPVEGPDKSTTVKFIRMSNPTRIWADIVKTAKTLGELILTGEIAESELESKSIQAEGSSSFSTEPQEVEVISPDFSFKYTPAASEAKIGQPVKVEIIAKPDVDKSIIDYRWIEPSDRKELGTGVIEIVPKDNKPIKLVVNARVPVHGDTIKDGIADEFTPGGFKVIAKVLGAKYDIGSQEWKPGQGLQEVQKGFVTDQHIMLGAEVEGMKKEDVKFEWSVTGDGCSIVAGQYSKEVTMSKSEPGSCDAKVIARDKENRTLGDVTVSFNVSDQDNENYADEIIAKARQLVSEGKLEEGLTTLSEGLSKYPKSKKLQAELDKLKSEKDQVLKHIENIKNLINQEKFDESETELAEAQKLHPLYQPVIDAKKMIKEAKIKLVAKKLEEAKKLVSEDKLDEAITLLEEANGLDPDNSEVTGLKEKIKTEIETINKHLTSFDKNLSQDKIKEAEEDLKVPNELHSKYQPVVDANERLKAKKDGNSKDKAAKLLEEAKQLASQDLLDEAIVKADEAKKLDSTSKEIIDFLSKVKSEKTTCLQHVEKTKTLVAGKKFDEAEKELQPALNLHPNYPPVKAALDYLGTEKAKYAKEIENKINAAEKKLNEKDFSGTLSLINEIKQKYILKQEHLDKLKTMEELANKGIKDKALAKAALKEGEILYNQFNYSAAVAKFTEGLITYKHVWNSNELEPLDYGAMMSHATKFTGYINEIKSEINNKDSKEDQIKLAIAKCDEILFIHPGNSEVLNYKKQLTEMLNSAKKPVITQTPKTSSSSIVPLAPSIPQTNNNIVPIAPIASSAGSIVPVNPTRQIVPQYNSPATSIVPQYNSPAVNIVPVQAQPGTYRTNTPVYSGTVTQNLNSPQYNQQNRNLMGLSNQQQNRMQGNNALQELDKTIGSLNTLKKNFDQQRTGGNNTAQGTYISVDPNTFNTDLKAGYGQSGNYGSTSAMDRVKDLSNKTSGWSKQNTPCNGPCDNGQAIPTGDGVPETNRNNGIDDDNDGVIDEGPMTGNCQIAIHDTGGDKDDQWQLTVDGNNIGVNTQGKTRFWDLNLARGNHTVTATGVAVPDNTGTYTIWFGRAQVVNGPPLTGSNLNQGTIFTWQIRVP